MTDTALNDDYIIALLKRDAEANKRQTRLPSSAYLSTAKRRPDAPKPNTRFLKNLVRDADSHNAALKAKEEADAKVRMEKLKRRREGEDGVARLRDGERQGRWASALGGLGAVEGGRRNEEVRGRGPRGEDRVRDGEGEGGRGERRCRRRSGDGGRRRRRDSRDDRRDGDDVPRAKSRSRERRRHHRGRNDDAYKDGNTRSRSRSRDPRRRRQNRTPSTSPPRPPHHPRENADTTSPPIPRGRGAHNPSTSTINAHFAPTYDPATDVAPDVLSEEDDWDLALEALRDRAGFRARRAERLRGAGFSEVEVGRGGEEGVRWRAVGEGREWDRGKVGV